MRFPPLFQATLFPVLIRAALLLVWSLTLLSCQPVISSQPSSTSPPPAILSSIPAATPTALPTSVLVEPDTPLITPTNKPQSSVAPDPLRFVFSTPLPAPVSAWRPPLYPTPWAPTAYDHFYFTRPIAADVVNWPVANYRYGGEFFDNVVHSGVDIPATQGSSVLAAGSGEVIWAGYGVYRGGYDVTDPYGLAVVIRHDFGYQSQPLFTIYGHLDQIDVAEGQYVDTGQTIGLVGETGHVTGPHLHFEVRVGENSFLNTRNPELWVVPPIGWGILAGRVLNSGGRPADGQELIIHSFANGQNWFARSYGLGGANSDPYYLENLVVGDLPAGHYELRLAYGGYKYTHEIDIQAGVVNYFIFDGFDGFILTTPSPVNSDFTPDLWGKTTPVP